MIPALLAGLVAGSLHVVAGPDHLAAVSAFAIERRGRAWRAGLKWGLGHAFGVAVVAAAAWLFRQALPLDALSGWGERFVGVVLVAIGLWTMRRALRTRVHVHAHDHDGRRHVHIHTHSPGEEHAAAAAHRHEHVVFGIGALHGLAGTAHLVGVLPALALSTTGAIAYVAGYAAGSVGTMTLFAWGLGGASTRLAHRGPAAFRGFLAAAGLAATGIGVFWIVA